MKKKNYYTIFNSKDEVVASGFAEECTKQMNTTLKTFFSIISKNKKQRSTYKIIIEKIPVTKNNQIAYEDD